MCMKWKRWGSDAGNTVWGPIFKQLCRWPFHWIRLIRIETIWGSATNVSGEGGKDEEHKASALRPISISFSSVLFSRSVVSNSCDLWTAARQASLSITNSQSLLKLMFIESVMPASHLILSRPLLLLPSTFPSIRVFSNESALRIRWPKYWSFSFNISPSNEHPGLISFGMDWLDLLAVQGTLKSLL